MIRKGIPRLFKLALRRRDVVEREVEDEILLHLDLRTEWLIARGMEPEAARGEALRRFGTLTDARPRLVEAARRREAQMEWSEWLATVRQDLGYAGRQLRRSPGFAIVAMLTLALGIGANATMFGVVDRLLLRPPAYVADPGRLALVSLGRMNEGEEYTQSSQSFPNYRDVAAMRDVYERVTSFSATELTLGIGADARQIHGLMCTASYFATLGVRPRIGRFFLPEDDGAPVGAKVVVLGYGFWQRQFGGDPSAVGQALSLAGQKYDIIGVAPEGFTGTGQSEIDAWIPLTAGITPAEYEGWQRSRNAYWLTVLARPLPTVSLEQAAARTTVVLREGAIRDGAQASRIAEQRLRAVLTSMLPRDARADRPETKVAVLLGAVSLLVLLLACANVANLQLARGIRRRREIAIRIALGVSRGRLLRQLVLESVVLALLGGVAALLVAQWGGLLVRRVLFSDIVWVDAPVDGRILLYTLLAALATGLLTGVLPAMQSSRPELAGMLKEGSREGRVHRSRTRLTLLLVQAALTVVLLVGTGLFVRSLRRVESIPLGMEPERVLVAQVQTTGRSYSSREMARLYDRFVEVVRATPGVDKAALGMSIPFWTSFSEQVSLPGRDSVPLTRDGGPYFNAVGPDFFQTMGTRILRGRGFTISDHATSQRVAIVNETLARLWWPGADALGKCMKVGGDTMPCTEVVGIAANARRQTMIEDESVQYFLPLEQAPAWADSRVLFVRPAGEARVAVESVRRRLQSAAPDLPYVRVRPLSALVSPQTRSWRLGATMFGAFGLLALVLASVGLYGMLAYDVTQRTRELGVRMALGAQRAQLARMIVGEGMRTAALGGAIGVTIALGSATLVTPLLYDTSPRDPAIYVAVVLVLGLVALVATLLPARRAVRVDPIVAMRAD